MELAPGAVIDRYVVEATVGEGGMAIVYRVRHAQLGSLHALKVLALPIPSLRGRLVQEGQLQASLRHPNVLAVTDIVDVAGAPGLIMEYVDGPNLESLLARTRLPIEEAEALAIGIIAGVSAAHRLGLIHRDLKPANVLLFSADQGFIPKVADFGLARLLSGGETAGGMRRTRSGMSMGTPSYMAPEQIRDAKGVDKRADIFSLGAILYDLYCGAQAFPGEDLLTVFNAITSGSFSPPSEHVPGLPDRVCKAIQGALQVSADARIPDCETLLATLLDGAQPAARPVLPRAGWAPETGTRSGAPEPAVPRVSSQTFQAASMVPDVFEPPPPAPTLSASHIARSRVLLLTDIVDSTRLAETLGDARMAEVWSAHDRAARDLLGPWRGAEIDRTDGFLLLFDAVPDAVGYALGYHAALRRLSLTFGITLQARVGVHVAEVILLENSREDVALGAKPLEVEGIAKPLAARVMSVATGGQTLLTAEARTQLPASRIRVESHGHWRLKGIAEPVELFEVGDEHAPFTPPPDAAKVYRVVRQRDLWIPRKEVRCVLSAEADAFVGREGDLLAIARLLDGGARLVTLLGTGGTGKTRLARRFAWTWLGDFPGGVYFCDLAEARDLQGIVAGVARALDVPLGNDDPVGQLGHAIAGRGECLILLDNFEQVAVHASATLGRWVDRAGSATFLVTSRERLSVSAEHILAVSPLPNLEAIRLFEARARLQQPDFSVTDSNRADIAAIIETLDGLPLAIELAAARIRILSPSQLRERLKERFKVLAGRSSSVRQGTLRAAIDWSWGLLTPWEQQGFAQLSAFESGFTLSAAEMTLDLSAWPDAPMAMDVVQALVDKSLLRVEQDRPGLAEPWFGMYSSMLDYSAEKLKTPGAYPGSGPEDQAATWKRHGDFFSALGAEEAIEALDTDPLRRRALAGDLDNLVVACKRAIQREDGAVAAATCRAAWVVWAMRGPSSVAARLGEAVLAMRGLDPGERARTARVAGLAQRMSANAGAAEAHLTAALELYRTVGDRSGEAVVLGNLGLLHMERGRMEEARREQEAALSIHQTGSRKLYGITLGNLAILDRREGRMDEARDRYERALEIHRQVGNRRDEAVVLGNLGLLNADQDRSEEARAQYEQALAVHREIGNRRGEGVMLGNLGDLLLALDRLDEALQGYTQALAIHREIGNRRFEGIMLGSLALVCARRGDHAQADAQFASGEVVLRSVGDQQELSRLLCARAEAHHRRGDRAAARTSLAEAQHLATAVRATPSTGLGRTLARVQSLVGAGDG